MNFIIFQRRASTGEMLQLKFRKFWSQAVHNLCTDCQPVTNPFSEDKLCHYSFAARPSFILILHPQNSFFILTKFSPLCSYYGMFLAAFSSPNIIFFKWLEKRNIAKTQGQQTQRLSAFVNVNCFIIIFLELSRFAGFIDKGWFFLLVRLNFSAKKNVVQPMRIFCTSRIS